MYAFSATLFCDSCGQAIKDELNKQGVGDSGDADDFPQYADELASETDCPSHCGSMGECLGAESLSDGTKVGALIGERLTTDGEAYVREAIESGGLVATELWAAEWPDGRGPCASGIDGIAHP
jgi:hypothetical protein